MRKFSSTVGKETFTQNIHKLTAAHITLKVKQNQCLQKQPITAILDSSANKFKW